MTGSSKICAVHTRDCDPLSSHVRSKHLMCGVLQDLLCLGLLLPTAAWGQSSVAVLVKTEISAPDPQAGMKSEHRFTINFKTKSIQNEEFNTGVTHVGPIDVKSVRDMFTIDRVDIQLDKATMRLVGQTASGVLLMPNIDYRFNLRVAPNGKGTLDGCHDGYPSYIVTINNAIVYQFKHGPMNLLKLFGTCDQVVQQTRF